MEFYYSDSDGQSVGPVSQAKIETLLQHGILNAQSLIAPVGESQWKTLATLFQIDTAADSSPKPARRSPFQSYAQGDASRLGEHLPMG